jgi:hypothetical protein
VAGIVPNGDVGASLDESFDTFELRVERCPVERGVPGVVAVVDGGWDQVVLFISSLFFCSLWYSGRCRCRR